MRPHAAFAAFAGRAAGALAVMLAVACAQPEPAQPQAVNPGSAPGPAVAAPDARRSGFEFMSPQTQAMQRDDMQNPGMLSVAEGEQLWTRPDGASRRACADCHAGESRTLRGVAARYPAFDAAGGRPINLQQRINLCRERRQRGAPWPLESRELLGLEAYVAHQSHGLPLAPPRDPRLQPHVARGQALYLQRIGQLNLSCAQCHDERAGLRLGGSLIPQAHPTGYPLYRLEWQALGSLQRRLRNCMAGVRAQVPAYGDAELVDLELYLAARAAGMALEAPAVRP
jgi:sulfur-oxidizing protein SoxA